MRTITTTPVHELTSALTADEIEELGRIDLANDMTPTITVPRVDWRIFEAITGSADGVILTSSDGAVFLGEVQDWDDLRAEVTVELR